MYFINIKKNDGHYNIETIVKYLLTRRGKDKSLTIY